jgi:hypothetical protein
VELELIQVKRGLENQTRFSATHSVDQVSARAAGARLRRSSRAQGFSLIEGVVAAAVLLAIALGILPLFTRSMINNEGGSDFTQISNAAKGRAEELFELPFNSPLLAITARTERVFEEYFSQRDKLWMPGVEADATADGDLALMRRTSTIRQFNVNDLLTPLDNSAPPGSVQIREIVVQVQSTRTGSPLGPGKETAVRVFKSQ